MPNSPVKARASARERKDEARAGEQVPLAVRPRHYGLGLRAQTLLALTAAFLLAFSALSVIIVQAAQKSHDVERARQARALAEALAVTLPPASAPVAREQALAALIGRAEIVGAELAYGLTAREHSELNVGATEGAPRASAWLPEGARLSLWMSPPEGDGAAMLGRLLRLYAFLTGALILTVVYIALTRLIVRPVERLTDAVERLPRSDDPQAGGVAVAGAAELVRLALAFNAMTRELRGEKAQLEARLRELEETTRMLRSTQDQLIRSEKLASVGRLAAGVAHEIGNPLSAILGLVELLQLGSLSRGEESEFLARIRSETERIHHIIRDLLDYARARPEGAGLPGSADLEQVVEEAVALIAPQKDLRRVTLERRVHGADIAVPGGSDELMQIVLNLLLNAADAVAGDGHILVELRREDDQVSLAISDSGPGIPAEVRDKLFDPFVTTKPAGKGTGLGLAVCHAIVERLGGSISGENLPHGGARFRVRLPAARAARVSELQ